MASFKGTPGPIVLGRDRSKRNESSADGLDVIDLSLTGLGLESQVPGEDCSSGQDDDDDESNTYNFLDPNETRRVVSDMIDTCQELDEKQGFQENENELFAQQVKHSKILFERQFGFKRRVSSGGPSFVNIKTENASSSSDESEAISPHSTPDKHGRVQLTQDQEAAVVADATASAMYLSYKHTKMCAGLMRKKVQAMGANEAVFSVEAYLTSLRKLGCDELGVYSSKRALNKVVIDTAFTIKTFPSFPCMLGAFDLREFKDKLDNKDEDVQKGVKTEGANKVKRGKLFGKDTKPAAHEEVNASQLNQLNSKKEETSTEFRKSLIKFWKEKKGPVNLFEFAMNKDSIRDTLNNTFTLAFGVRDGSIELAQDAKLEKNKLALSVEPCPIPKKKSNDESNSVNRRQCILSVSSKVLRKMQSLAEGDSVIDPTS